MATQNLLTVVISYLELLINKTTLPMITHPKQKASHLCHSLHKVPNQTRTLSKPLSTPQNHNKHTNKPKHCDNDAISASEKTSLAVVLTKHLINNKITINYYKHSHSEINSKKILPRHTRRTLAELKAKQSTFPILT